MPIVFRYEGYKFFFYSNEGNPREPIHVHVRSPDGEAKFWLFPAVYLEASKGFDAGILRELSEVIEQNSIVIERAWNEHFS